MRTATTSRSKAAVMRYLLLLTLLLPSLVSAAAQGMDDARHLLGRAGLGASPRQIIEFSGLSRVQAVDRLLATTHHAALTPPPEWVSEAITPRHVLRDMSPDERKDFEHRERQRGLQLRGWWLQEMLGTPSPLTERMTLFWHNHFVSGQHKVRQPQLLYQQNALLRRHATGNFAELLHAVAKDPAMLIYLDSASNRKDQPNENFAREVMELFTLGEGHYGEQDIRDAARAFTGWSVDPDNGEFRWRPAQHDMGEKTVLGHSGNLTGDEVLDLLLAQPATADFIVAKLWREFVSPGPANPQERRERAQVAARFRASAYDLETALRALFLTRSFWAASNRGTLLKSPVDLVVGTIRQFEIPVSNPLPLVTVTTQLGQNLFAPPNVKGWPGGTAWINSQTLLGRKQFAERVFRADGMPRLEHPAQGDRPTATAMATSPGDQRGMPRTPYEIVVDADGWLASLPGSASPSEIERFVLARPPAGTLPVDARGRELLRLLALDPAYQLR
jgi:uncharacterized protein (DUF1800 family)